MFTYGNSDKNLASTREREKKEKLARWLKPETLHTTRLHTELKYEKVFVHYIVVTP